jgi:hypothetical protein
MRRKQQNRFEVLYCFWKYRENDQLIPKPPEDKKKTSSCNPPATF